MYRSTRTGGFRAENLGHNAVKMIANLCFTIFVLIVLIFTFMAATYQPEDPFFHPSSKITSYLTSNSNSTFSSDRTLVKTGEDFAPANQSVFSSFINITDIDAPSMENVTLDCKNEADNPVDCTDTEVFHTMMRAAIEHFKDIHFYRFGKPVTGSNSSTCDMAWRFVPKHGNASAFYKDYRRFIVSKTQNCTFRVHSIGGYHSGVNARKRRRNQQPGFQKTPANQQVNSMISLPIVGDTVNDSLPMIESEASFSHGRYLIYSGGGDRCKSMDHYLWSFLCALGESRYLNRTLIMDLSVCLSSIYSSSNQDEEGKNFRFYFDFEHLREAASVLDQDQFWAGWSKWEKKHKLTLYLVEDFRVAPMKLLDVKDSLIMRKFGSVEPDNYWYRVCEGETEGVIRRPWHLLWKSPRLMAIVSAISSRLNWDFDSIHVVRGEKVKNTKLWPNLARDTSPDAILSSLHDKIERGRSLYVSTNEQDLSFFDPLKDRFSTHFLDEYGDLWDENSEWYSEMSKLNNGVPVEFDGYMRVSVDTEVFLRGKKQIETFNDLTNDCKDGIKTCSSAS